MATTTYVPIEAKTLASATSTVTFSSIPQTYTDLVLVANLFYTPSYSRIDLQVGNGSVDTGSNYSVTEVYGQLSTYGTQRNSNQTMMRIGYAIGDNTAWGLQVQIYFQNYSNTTTYKTVLNRCGLAGSNGTPGVTAGVGLWRSTNAIDIIKIFSPNSNNYAAGSTFTLYGIATLILVLMLLVELLPTTVLTTITPLVHQEHLHQVKI